jgi:hypothetical protein
MGRKRAGSEWGLEQTQVLARAKHLMPARSHFRGVRQQDPAGHSSHTVWPSAGRAARAARTGAGAGAGPAFLPNHDVKDSSFSWQ